jgi:hypothetical protein
MNEGVGFSETWLEDDDLLIKIIPFVCVRHA